MTGDRSLTTFRLIGVPLELWHRARVWFEGLIREFDVLAADTGETTPRELLQFVGEVRERFSGFTEGSDIAMEKAHARGEQFMDVELELPPAAAPAARELWDQIQRAEEYCRRGDLLTLTPDDELRRYLHWYLHEIADQAEGAVPRPWEPQPPTR